MEITTDLLPQPPLAVPDAQRHLIWSYPRVALAALLALTRLASL